MLIEKFSFHKQHYQIFCAFLIALYWVIFLWNFWQRGVYAWGINAAVFLLLILLFFNSLDKQKCLFRRHNLPWLIPMTFILLSFAIYENPFIKVINIILWPILLTIFFNYSLVSDNTKKYWHFGFFFTLVARIFAPLTKLLTAVRITSQTAKFSEGTKTIFKKSAIGLVLLFLVSTVFIIPLLASADPDFAKSLGDFYVWLGRVISAELSLKILFFIFFSLVLYAIFLAWQKPLDYKVEDNTKNIQTDSIIAGIVISGILVLYLLFLLIQLNRILVNALPVNFQEVEVLVKSGFWQLMFLSIVNITIFFFSFRKTNRLVQGILAFFTAASLLLLASAAYRMFLYVFFYGFSYEKFYASYVVLYCAILFIYLISRFFYRKKLDILKFTLFLFLWMYGIINILPTEQFILRANIALAAHANSQINLFESSILSADVLGYIEANGQNDFMKVNHDNQKTVDWQSWISWKKSELYSKQPYELNMANILYKLGINF